MYKIDIIQHFNDYNTLMTVASMHEISFLTTYVSCYSNNMNYNKPKDVTLLTDNDYLSWLDAKQEY